MHLSIVIKPLLQAVSRHAPACRLFCVPVGTLPPETINPRVGARNAKGDTMEKRVYQSLRELPLMLSMMDVASVLGISKAGAYTLAHSRDFPAFRVGRRIVISQEKFLEWLEKQATESSLT